MAYRSVVLEDGPAAYWRLGDSGGAVVDLAYDSAGSPGGGALSPVPSDWGFESSATPGDRAISVTSYVIGNRWSWDQEVTLTGVAFYPKVAVGTIHVAVWDPVSKKKIWGQDMTHNGGLNAWGVNDIPDLVMTPNNPYVITIFFVSAGGWRFDSQADLLNIGAHVTHHNAALGYTGMTRDTYPTYESSTQTSECYWVVPVYEATTSDHPQRGTKVTTDREVTVSNFRYFTGKSSGTLDLRIRDASSVLWSDTVPVASQNTWHSAAVPDLVLPAGTYYFTMEGGNAYWNNDAVADLVGLGTGVTIEGVFGGSGDAAVLTTDPAFVHGLTSFEYTYSGANTAAIDETGNHHGTYVGSPTLGVAGALTGDTNTAVALAGDGSKVTVPDAAVFDMPENFSLEAWVTPADIANDRTIISKGDANGYEWTLFQSNLTGSVRFSFLMWNTGVGAWMNAVASNVTPTVGVTYHIVATYDGTTARIYINGALEGSTTTKSSIRQGATAAPVNIGGRADNSAATHWNGTLDEVAVYNHALTPDRIARHYHHGLGKVGFDLEMWSSRPLSWFKFEEASGTPVDETGNHAIASTSGTPTLGAGGLTYGSAGALTVDAGDGYSTNQTAALNGAWTQEAWILPTVNSGTSRSTTVCHKAENGVIWYDHTSAGASVSFKAANGVTYQTSFGQLLAGTLYHLVGVMTGTALRAYVNGALVSEVAVGNSTAFATTGWFVGGIDGVVDEVALYDRALPAWEIRRHYQRGIAVFNAKHDIVLRDGAALWLDAREATGDGTAVNAAAQTAFGGNDNRSQGQVSAFQATADFTVSELELRGPVSVALGTRSRRFVILNSDRSAYVAVSAYNSASWGIDAHLRLPLLEPAALVSGQRYWIGWELETPDATGFRSGGKSNTGEVYTGNAGDSNVIAVQLVPGGSSTSFLDGTVQNAVLYTHTFALYTPTLATWVDATGNARNATQGTAAAQPVLAESTLGTQPVVRFDGTDDWLAAPISGGAQRTYIFVAIKRTPAGSPSAPLLNTGPHAVLFTDTDEGGVGWRWYADGAANSQSLAMPAVDTPHVVTVLHVTTEAADFRHNAVLTNSLDPLDASEGATGTYEVATSIQLGTNSVQNLFGDVDIAEILYFDRVLLAHELKQIEQDYLARRYGVGSTQVPVEEIESGGYTPPPVQDVAPSFIASEEAFYASGVTRAVGDSYRGLVVADSPTAYWRLGESSGTTAADETGTHPGTYVGSPTLGVAGALKGDANTGVRLDGVDDYVNIPDAPGLDFTGDFTIEFWMKAPSVAEDWEFLVSKGDDSWRVLSDGSTNGLAFFAEATPATAPKNSTNVFDNQWHHIVAVRSGGNGTIWVDGSSANSTTVAMPNVTVNARPLRIGADEMSTGRHTEGTFDEVAVYPHALTADRIARHYELGVRTFAFEYTGAYEEWTVPEGVTSISVDLYGAQGGGSNSIDYGQGGLGGRVACDVPVTPGETLRIYVGGQGFPNASALTNDGGWNGGGAGGTFTVAGGGGGGGATDIRRAPYGLADRLVVAGGGGGQGGNDNKDNRASGIGATPTGGTGADSSPYGSSQGGVGGTQAAGGAGGTGESVNGSAGALGVGGQGANVDRSGGGGGGGYYGAGGGGGTAVSGNAGGAGGGGAGLSTGVNETIQNGVRSGHGTLTIVAVPPPQNVSPVFIATGEALHAPEAALGKGYGSYRGVVLEDGPLMYWRLGEASGSSAADESGNGNTGTFYGTDYTRGVAGVLVDDTDLAAEIRSGVSVHSPLADFTSIVQTYTIEFWAKPTALADTNAMTVTNNAGAWSGRWTSHGSATGQAYVGTTTTNRFVIENYWVIGEWTHFVYTNDNGNARLYRNGLLIASGTQTNTAALDSFVLAPRAAVIDEFTIYKHALSADRIARHYYKGKGEKGFDLEILSSRPNHWWKLEDPASVTDEVGGNSGTLVGATGTVTSDGGPGYTGQGIFYTEKRAHQLTSFGATLDLTVEGWIKLGSDLTDDGSDTVVLSSGRFGTSHSGMVLGWYQNKFRFIHKTSTDLLAVDHTPDNQWHYLVGTYNATTGAMRLYVDGVMVASKTAATGGMTPSTSDTHIKGAVVGTTLYTGVDASLDEVAMYRRELAPWEIRRHYLRGVGKFSGKHDIVLRDGLNLWLDAADAGVASGALSSWVDRSGNNHHATQSTVASRPALSANAFGIQPGVDFDGVDDYLTFATTFFNSSTAKGSVLLVGKRDNIASAHAGLFSARNDTGIVGGAGWTFSTRSPDDLITYHAGHTGAPLIDVNLEAGFMVGFVRDGLTYTMRANGQASASTAISGYTAPGSQGMVLAREQLDWSGYYWPGAFGEVISYDRALLPHELKQIETDYLARRYGIGTTQVPEENIGSGSQTPVPYDQTVSDPTFITSGEALYAPTVVPDQPLEPVDIPSVEAFYAPTVTVAAVEGGVEGGYGAPAYGEATYGEVGGATAEPAPSGIPYPSTSTWPSTTLYPGDETGTGTAQNIAPTYVETGEVVFGPGVGAEPAPQLAPGFIASAETVHAPTTSVAPAPAPVVPTFVGTGEAFYGATVSVTAPPAPIEPLSIASGEALYSPDVTVEIPGVIQTPFISSAEAFYVSTVTVTPPPAPIQPTFIASTASLFAPTVIPEQVLEAGFIASGEALYAPSITVPPTQDLAPGFIGSLEVFYGPVLTYPQVVTPDFVSSQEVVYTPKAADIIFKVWDGEDYVSGVAWVWNGTEFLPVKERYSFDGSTWVKV